MCMFVEEGLEGLLSAGANNPHRCHIQGSQIHLLHLLCGLGERKNPVLKLNYYLLLFSNRPRTLRDHIAQINQR